MRAVYTQYICSKTGDECSIYEARKWMRVCDNNNMCNPSLHLLYYGLRMLLLLHALIHCLAAYCPHPLSCCILPSSPVLLHTALIPCLAAYNRTTALVSLLFGTVIPTSSNILVEMFLLPFRNIDAPHS